MARRLCLTPFLVLLACHSFAAEPRSAIPWLSESVRNPVLLGPVSSTPFAGADKISSSTLDVIDRDALGLVAPEISGLPADLWGTSPKDTIADLILSHPHGGVPATRALFRQILLASTDSPNAASGSKNLLLARIDGLLQIGALDDAEALLSLAGVTDQESYRRMVDIGLLTGRADPVCAKFAASPNIAPTLPIRVFCLARASDWNAAALTLSLGIEIGAIPADQGELLTMFLDPHLFEEDAELPLPANLSAFDFVIRESLALPRPTENLPAAFLHVDLVRDTPMRIRIEAAEKLVRSGAISHTQLFAAYRAGKPAASGGIWDRAAAAQALDKAMAMGDRGQILAAFTALNAAVAGLDLDVAIANEYTGQLMRLVPDDQNPDVYKALLLNGDITSAANWQPKQNATFANLIEKIFDSTALQPSASTDPLQNSILAAFSETQDISEHGNLLLEHLSEGRSGEAILGALAILSQTSQDPRDLSAALHVLVKAGLTTQAHKIALEILLLQSEAL